MLTTTKPKACKNCRTMFAPRSSTARACSPMCAIELGAKAKQKKALADAKVERAVTKTRKEKAKTNGQRKAEAQAAINRWIVHVRDADKPCISCGRFHQGAWHAGHYRSRGSAPHLSLDPRNLAKQCAPCNLHLHGNLIAFRVGLVALHGAEFVEALEADDAPRHLGAADFDAIKADYRARVRAHLSPH